LNVFKYIEYLHPFPGSFFVRVVHVIAMAAILGAGIFLLLGLRSRPVAVGDSDQDSAVKNLVLFEYLFWVGISVLAATGIGNLGAIGESLPPDGSRWRMMFGLKQFLVGVLLFESLIRTLCVAHLAERGLAVSPRRFFGWIRRAHGVTVFIVASIAILGLSLAHA
jgi:hypothetical protein